MDHFLSTPAPSGALAVDENRGAQGSFLTNCTPKQELELALILMRGATVTLHGEPLPFEVESAIEEATRRAGRMACPTN